LRRSTWDAGGVGKAESIIDASKTENSQGSNQELLKPTHRLSTGYRQESIAWSAATVLGRTVPSKVLGVFWRSACSPAERCQFHVGQAGRVTGRRAVFGSREAGIQDALAYGSQLHVCV
jgi:hypothetical protein